MECAPETLEQLVDLQAVDFRILNLKRTFDTLPQRQTILKLRQQLSDVRARQAKVAELYTAAQAVVDDIDEQANSTSAKKAAVEQALMNTATGYRDVEARQKELAALAKRLETFGHKRTTAQRELDKVTEARGKIDAALAALEQSEATEIASFRSQGAQLLADIKAAEAERAALAPAIDPAMLATYEKASSRCGGVGLSRLNGATCSVCRAAIDEARLNQVRHEAPLSTCPQCRRLLIVE